MKQTVSIHQVPVLIGASNYLVAQRELRNKYCTNRSIKTWSFYFLLKSLSTSGHIQSWTKQRAFLFEYLNCNEQTFRTRLNELKQLGLADILSGYCIQLRSYKNAASILDIEYQGLETIAYDSSIKGTSVFAYMLTAQEFRHNQDAQRTALSYHIDKNPLLLNLLIQLLQQQGCDIRRLKSDPVFFQEQLLKLQETSFKQGSEILTEILQRRADVNRGVKKIAEHHSYKHHSSVTYLKRVMEKLGLVRIVKRFVISEARSRRYVPGEAARKDGYRWLKQAKATCWHLCDQIIINAKFFKQNEKENALLATEAA